MATTNSDHIGKALELLRDGLAPYMEREMKSLPPEEAVNLLRSSLDERDFDPAKPLNQLDVAALLKLLWSAWQAIFRNTLGQAERSLVSELRTVRNNWAHQNPFSYDDTYRALDSISRLLTAVSATGEAQEVDRRKEEVMRVKFSEQARNEKRKESALIKSQGTAGLKPWREVVTPHQDVISGTFQQAEFAADLWQVHLGGGSSEYLDPTEFFRRTYLTQSLIQLLKGAVKRLSGQGGDPVVQLQTNFGGGKTHSMLALYHLFSGVHPGSLPGIEELLAEMEAAKLPDQVRRVVLVGNKISPGNPVIKDDGTKIHTLWGELAWQLGGRAAFDRIAEDDRQATNPGDRLRELFEEYGPALVLIDEWVAYARQLHDQSDLPGGSFETHFTFAQALTESAKNAKNCLLVISLPASSDSGASTWQVDDVEVGGERGRDALARLHNVTGRVESSWRPATAEEGFEIVRRRLFEPIIQREQDVHRTITADAFFDLYKNNGQDFPGGCREADYKKRLLAAYPIHPEVFDRLYQDWSTLVKFQRTRGVLRLMATVIHSLWEKGDANPLIMPANISLDDQRIQFELTRYLSDNWTPIIAKDVDGPDALPRRLDSQNSTFGRHLACRRVTRTIYLGSAPIAQGANRGLDDRHIKLGCVMPGETPAVFGDALRHLAQQATYLYQDSGRYWFSTQPTVTKLAEERAEELKRNPDQVLTELNKLIRQALEKRGDWNRLHPLPGSSQEVPDDPEARLVVLSPEAPHTKNDQASPAIVQAKNMLDSRGNSPRSYRNALVFLAADKTRLADLEEAVRNALAWSSILKDKVALNLDPHQTQQAEERLAGSHKETAARIPETYCWLIVPTQSSPQPETFKWEEHRLAGDEDLAVRAFKKLRHEELLMPVMAGTRLRLELDRIPLWRDQKVSIKQLGEDFGRYLFLPRLSSLSVLSKAITDGLNLLSWDMETFAYADSFDEAKGRFVGLRPGGQSRLEVSLDDPGCLVHPTAAKAQMEAERPPESGPAGVTTAVAATPTGGGQSPPVPYGDPGEAPESPPNVFKRYYGEVGLDPNRVGRDASRIANEVIAHLTALVDADVRVTLSIEAILPNGAPISVARTVIENGITLGFDSGNFEKALGDD